MTQLDSRHAPFQEAGLNLPKGELRYSIVNRYQKQFLSDGAVDFVLRRSLRRTAASVSPHPTVKGIKPHWCNEALNVIGWWGKPDIFSNCQRTENGYGYDHAVSINDGKGANLLFGQLPGGLVGTSVISTYKDSTVNTEGRALYELEVRG